MEGRKLTSGSGGEIGVLWTLRRLRLVDESARRAPAVLLAVIRKGRPCHKVHPGRNASARKSSRIRRIGGVPVAREFNVIIERDSEGYYVGSVPALQGCHTQAKSLDELMERIREAIELCLEAQGDKLEPLDFVGVQRVTVS